MNSVRSVMQFDVQEIENIPDDKLKEVSAALVTKLKEVKKKLSVQLKNDKALQTAWLSTMAMDPPKALPEEIAEFRKQKRRDFAIALLANPEAFVTYQINSFLLKLNDEVRSERVRRTPMKNDGKT